MPRKKNVNHPALLKAVESGQPAKEIMRKFNLTSLIQLKSHYLDALVENGRVTGLAAKPKAPKTGPDKLVEVNGRGSLIIPKEFIEGMGFRTGETFAVRGGKKGVSLIRA